MRLASLKERYLYDRGGKSKLSVFSHPVFLAGLGIKAIAIVFLGSNSVLDGYLAVAQQFAVAPFSNPYEWSLAQGIPFPFPFLVLFVTTVASILFGFAGSALAIKIPMLLADIVVLLLLTRWLRGKEEQVLWYYWCSPLIFAICYIAGFLDIVPVALLFACLYFLFKERLFTAFVALGLALGAKTGFVILLPFIAAYLVKEHVPLYKVFGYSFIAVALYGLINAPYITSPAFWSAISAGGMTLASLIAIDFGGVAVYVAPLVYAGLLVACVSFQRLTKDIFLMFVAFALGVVTLFVVPQAGWYAWIVPFFIYFFIKEERVVYPFVLLNLAYFCFFLVLPGSVFAGLLPPVGQTGINAAFTALQGALLLTIVSIYRLGIQKRVQHKLLYRPYLVGVAGDSASGKSTVSALIAKVFGSRNTLEVAGDDMHKWERGDPNWKTLTHLNPSANRLHDDLEHLLSLKKNEQVARRLYDHTVGRFTPAERVRPKRIIVFQGLHALYLNHARESLDLKIFLAPQETLRRAWKVDRDTKERGHAPEHVLRQLDERDADAQKYIHEQRKYADTVLSFGMRDGHQALEIECDNSIYLEPLVSALGVNTSLAVSHEQGDSRQRLFVEGDITAESVDASAYTLVPGLWDINKDPQWEQGLHGVTQLFLAYVILYKARLEHGPL